MQKVLVVVAHPDDEILGVGGTVRRLADEGKEIRALIMAEGLTSRAAKRSEADLSELDELRADARKAAGIIGYETIDFCDFPDNRMDSVDLLDIIKVISGYIEKYDPDTIFTHHSGDLNVDHKITCKAVLTACRPINGSRVKRIYGFETPSSTEWNYTYEKPFLPNVYFDVTATIDGKIEAMKCYRSESADYPHPRSTQALRSLARLRGSNVGFIMAEAFMLLRECM